MGPSRQGTFFTWAMACCRRMAAFILLSCLGPTLASPSSRATASVSSHVKRETNGYVAFGDSYAAGMGTGTTTSDSCRIGSNNIGDLLYEALGSPAIDYQRLMCSGDSLVGLTRQVDTDWKLPALADLATLSIGWNDVGFSQLVHWCITTPFILYSVNQTRARCQSAKEAARTQMQDHGRNGLPARLTAAYLNILNKPGKEVGLCPIPSMAPLCTSQITVAGSR
jgi:hypothetical protein